MSNIHHIDKYFNLISGFTLLSFSSVDSFIQSLFGVHDFSSVSPISKSLNNWNNWQFVIEFLPTQTVLERSIMWISILVSFVLIWNGLNYFFWVRGFNQSVFLIEWGIAFCISCEEGLTCWNVLGWHFWVHY